MFDLSPTDKLAISFMGRVLTKVMGRQQRRELDRKLSFPRRRPLDRRLEHPLSIEDENMVGSVSFAEHEHGLTVTATFYHKPPVKVELDERSSRVLCYYLSYKVEGGPALDLKWDQPVSFHDKNRKSRMTIAEHEDGLSIMAESGKSCNVIINIDNWYSIQLSRYLLYKIEGEPFGKNETSQR